MKKNIWIVPLLLVALCGCKAEVSALGLDSGYHVVQGFFDQYSYRNQLVNSVLDIEDSAIPVLAYQTQHETKWELQLVTIGLGLNAAFGIGPFRVGITPGVRAFFTNQENPPPLP